MAVPAVAVPVVAVLALVTVSPVGASESRLPGSTPDMDPHPVTAASTMKVAANFKEFVTNRRRGATPTGCLSPSGDRLNTIGAMLPDVLPAA
ncbi:hypothetical protein GCM10023317_40230 [Actinopolymorpha pittospori]